MNNMINMIGQDRINKGLYWTKAWSLIEGCTPTSPGCAHCWSAAQTHMRKHQENLKIRARYSGLTTDAGAFNGKIRLMYQNLELPLRTRKPTVWAVWNDLFHEDVGRSFVYYVLTIMDNCPQHIFLLLTKRPRLMATYFDHKITLKNVWLGFTAETQELFDERWHYAKQIPASVIWLSYEPALGSLILPQDFLDRGNRGWVVLGGETGPGARPMHLDWVRIVRDDCVAAKVPFFFKSWGKYIAEAFQDSMPGNHAMRQMGHHTFFPERLVKKEERRLLDGRTWDETPQVS